MPDAKDPNQPGADPIDTTEVDPNQNPGGDGGANPNENQDFNDPVKAKAEIEKLRKEAAKYRTQNKELSGKVSGFEAQLNNFKKALGGNPDEKVTPEELIAQKDATIAELQNHIFVSELEQESGITGDDRDYFRFLLNKKLSSLEEGEELDDEGLAEIVKQTKAVSGKKAGGSTGLSSKNDPKPDSGGTATTVEQFVAMSMGDKSLLFQKNPAEYNRLFGEAAKVGKI